MNSWIVVIDEPMLDKSKFLAGPGSKVFIVPVVGKLTIRPDKVEGYLQRICDI
jgi:hypothetical protein